MDHFGYKKCGNYIVKLLIPGYAVTNEYRSSVHNILRAKHRTNIAIVSDIIHENGFNNPRYVVSTFHKKWIKYEIGKVIEIRDFDYNLNKICAPGIHYFLNFDQAKNYDGSRYSYSGNKTDGLVFFYDGNGKNVYTIQFRNGYPQKTFLYGQLK